MLRSLPRVKLQDECDVGIDFLCVDASSQRGEPGEVGRDYLRDEFVDVGMVDEIERLGLPPAHMPIVAEETTYGCPSARRWPPMGMARRPGSSARDLDSVAPGVSGVEAPHV